MSTLDLALTSVLQVLPRRPEFVEEPASMIYSRMASIASRLAVEAAFAERLTSTDAHALGLCSANGVLTEAGSIFAAMTLPEYDRSESRTETIIRARAVINEVTLVWSFSSSETAACFILRCRGDTTGASESAPPNLLLRVDASRPEGIDRAPARVVARAPLLEELDRRFIHSGLDAAALCHVLIGLLRRCLLLSGSRIAMRMSSTRFCDVSGGVTAVQNTVQTQTIDHDGGADTSKRAGAAAGSHDEPMSATARAPVRRAPLPAAMNNYSCTEM